MSPSTKFNQKTVAAHAERAQAATKSIAFSPLLPIGALLLTGSLGAMAQSADAGHAPSLSAVVVTEKAEAPAGKDAVRAVETTIGKGKQQLRDIPQSITVVTEKLIDDRNLDTLKDVLHNTAGVTFQAAEGGEEDIRLRGFSLATTGDIFVDGMRDPAFYERDTFNNDRIELLRGSASMLFGRGSTGGAVNQVSKPPRAMDEHEVSATLGSNNYRRVTGDFNIQTGEDAGLRINAMATKADSNGAGARLDKKGIAASYRFGIGTADEFLVSLYALQNDNGINYGMPWIRPTATSPGSESTLNNNLGPNTYYGLASDYNKGTANHLTLTHTHRFDSDSELKTTLRTGQYTRDQRAGAIRFCQRTVNATNGAVTNPTCPTPRVALDTVNSATVLTRGNNNKLQDLDATYAQSDYSNKFNALGLRHEVLAGVDLASERKQVYSLSAVTKPTTTIGSIDDGAAVDEAGRTKALASTFQSNSLGLYAQDLLQIAPHWKLLGGLRFDKMRATYDNLAASGAITSSFEQSISDWSHRVGALYQPNVLHSYHVSYGTSFNTSGDTYSYTANTANAGPEESRNFEVGAKLDSADKRFTTRLAVFHSTKFNERNTDPDSAAATQLLSGTRSTAGLEIDLSGRLTPRWEIYGSYMWMPHATVDEAAPCPATGACAQGAIGSRQGDCPGLMPVHTGTLWNTYQFTAALRGGVGINVRSAQAPATVSATNGRAYMAPGYATVDLMAEYRFNDRYTLKANMANVADTLYADALYAGHYVPGSGRNTQVTLNIKF
jgi:catecholate siderophore receptor